jgi:hypothetical protein
MYSRSNERRIVTMKSHYLSLFCLSLAPTLSGCVLFHADFESDTVGVQPSASPAGRPTGDEIQILAADSGNIVVIADRLFGNSLRHSPQETVSQIFFTGIETRRAVEEFFALWDGCADRWSSDTPRYFFTVGNLNTGTANLEIENGEFRAAGERIDDVVFGEIHSVSIHVNNTAGTYTVTIAQADPTLGDGDASCSTAGESRPACPEDFRFERGACRSGPNWLGYRSHCPLEGPASCAICRDGEVLDTMNGTCINRSRARARVTSTARPLSRGVISEVSPVRIGVSYDNIAPSDPASYIIDDIWIYKPSE